MSVPPLEQLAVVGAAGKMGSGISLLLLQEMARSKIMQEKEYTLTLIDASQAGLKSLKKYLYNQMLKWAEKNITYLRQAVAENVALVSNKEVIDHFMTNCMDAVNYASSLEEAKNAQLIFEAIPEEVDAKVHVLSTLQKQSGNKPYFFSNTSSIPISHLNERALLEGRIIGFHFYNPPAVQKLIEIIPLDQGDPELLQGAIRLAQRLKKDIVFSKDVAGFIGNGYFLREIMYGCALTEELSQKYGIVQSLYLINKVTQDFLLRPMGMFQLIDYVGLDVVSKIGTIMHQFLQLPIRYTNLFQPLIQKGIYGGQYGDGTQKDGFFQYKDNAIIGIYSAENLQYIPLPSEDLAGSPPDHLSWKAVTKSSRPEDLLQNYFAKLSQEKTLGAQLAMNFLQNLQKIAIDLVDQKVAKCVEDVDVVLKKGFYHLYGACNYGNV